MEQKKLTVKELREWLGQFPDSVGVHAYESDFGAFIIVRNGDGDHKIDAPEFPSLNVVRNMEATLPTVGHPKVTIREEPKE